MNNFDDIRPYNQSEFREAYYRLMDQPGFQDAVSKFLPNYSVDDLRRDFDNFHSIDDVQANFIRRWLELFINQFTTGFIASGLENLDPEKAYLFISNHRDITFDPAVLQYYLFTSHWKTSKIAIGDNLLKTPLLGEVGRLNKMIKVIRSGSMREKLANSQRLAAYIQYSLFEEHESVWIAQRDGRTKDGNDYTKHGLVKMITLGNDKNLMETIRRMNITPVTVSYEYEPCDKLKARELALSENSVYQKQPGEDFNSIKQGIFGQKGRITFTIGTPIQDELDTIPEDISNNEKINLVCQLIDKQIYRTYTLYSNNYIAHDLLHKDEMYREHYTDSEKSLFEQYLLAKSQVPDVPEAKMRENLLKIYATPVDNHYKTISEEN